MGCHSATLSEALLYYGADAVSNELKESATRQLNSGRTDWVVVGFSIFGMAIAESVKEDINRQLCVPLQPVKDQSLSKVTNRRLRR
jgi:hypothetical protein